jgi:hypothetical protein
MENPKFKIHLQVPIILTGVDTQGPTSRAITSLCKGLNTKLLRTTTQRVGELLTYEIEVEALSPSVHKELGLIKDEPIEN